MNIDLGNAAGPVTRHQIAPKSLHDDNEDAENVTIASDTLEPKPMLGIELPRHSITALAWTAPEAK